MMESIPESPVVQGRRCGKCTLCCKVLRIEELKKPQGTWCEHCNAGVGCKIYGRHPQECAHFYCEFLKIGALSEEWWPAKSKIVLVSELDGYRIAAHVDPSQPGVWKEEPYYSQLKRWARAAVPYQAQVVVGIRNRAIVILPDKDVDLGPLSEDELIVIVERAGPSGPDLSAIKIKQDDPRAALSKPGAKRIVVPFT